jgi:methionine biosynthesis protein MetW
VELIKPNSTVVDFGCGNGSLLLLLKQLKDVDGLGYDISPSGVEACKRKSIPAVCVAIDRHHPELRDRQFDYAICNVTLQMVMYPEVLLKEMARVARFQIVSFPNFAFYTNRLDMLFHGRMPKPFLCNYTWYSTGHIHQLSLRDFEELVRAVGGLRIVKRCSRELHNPVKRLLLKALPNLFETIPVYLLQPDDAQPT